MATTRISDVIVPEEFAAYTVQNSLEKSALVTSGIAVRNGAIDAQNPALRAHLWASTLDKLAIDQPAYAPYRRALQQRAPTTQTPQE